MIIFDWLLFIFSWLFFSIGVFVVFSCFVALMRQTDFFIRIHAIKLSNIYGISCILLGVGLSEGNALTILQLFAIIILNILTTITVVHAVCRIALNNNIVHGGFSRRKYNELMSEKEKQEAEKRMQERKAMEEAKNKATSPSVLGAPAVKK